MIEVVIDHGILGYYASVGLRIDNCIIHLNEGHSMSSREIGLIVENLGEVIRKLELEQDYLASRETFRESRRVKDKL